MTRVAGLNQHPLLFTEHLSSSDRRAVVCKEPGLRDSPSSKALWLAVSQASSPPGQSPLEDLRDERLTLWNNPYGRRGSAPLCSLTRVSLSKDRGPEPLLFSSYAQSTRSPSGPPLPGAASGQCLGRASSERESQERRGSPGRAGGLTAMAWSYTPQVSKLYIRKVS